MIPSPVTHLAGLTGPAFLEALATSVLALGEPKSAAAYRQRAGQWRDDQAALDQARAQLATCRALLASPPPPDLSPDGWHHVYTGPDGAEVIRTDGAGTWNGQRPLRALPYFYRPQVVA